MRKVKINKNLVFYHTFHQGNFSMTLMGINDINWKDEYDVLVNLPLTHSEKNDKTIVISRTLRGFKEFNKIHSNVKVDYQVLLTDSRELNNNQDENFLDYDISGIKIVDVAKMNNIEDVTNFITSVKDLIKGKKKIITIFYYFSNCF